MSNEFEDEDFMEPESPLGPRTSGAKTLEPEELLRAKAAKLDLAKIVRSILEDRIKTKVDELIAGKIEKEIDAVLEEGWKATNEWGESENYGQRVGIRDRIASFLSKQSRDSYRKCKADSYIEDAVKDAVKTLVDDEGRKFEKELKEWKKQKMADRLRQALDGAIFR